MKNETEKNYYTLRKNKLLKQFDRIFIRVNKYLTKHYDANFAKTVIDEARQDFISIIPELPYIGGRKNFFTPVIIINGWIISLLRVMKTQGKTVEDVVTICCEVSDDYFKSIPHIFLRWENN